MEMKRSTKRPAPRAAGETNPIVVTIKKRKKRPRHFQNKVPNQSKPGLPNLTKDLTEAPPSPAADDNNDDVLFPPLLEDAIPCDTLLAVQALTASSQAHASLAIPLLASSEVIRGILQSQIFPFLKQDTQKKRENPKQ